MAELSETDLGDVSKTLAAPVHIAREKIGYWSCLRLQKKSADTIDRANIWLANRADPHEAGLINLMHEAASRLGMKSTPQLVIFKSDRPEIINVDSTYLAVSTNMASILKPEQMMAMMAQKLEVRHHQAANRFVKWVASPLAVLGAFIPIEHFLDKHYPQYSSLSATKRAIGHLKYEQVISKVEGNSRFSQWLNGIKPELLTFEQTKQMNKDLLIAAAAFGALKLMTWVPLERWYNRHYEKKQDASAAQNIGTGAMIGALEAVNQREHELQQHGAQEKWTKRITPKVFRDNPSTENRIANLKKKRHQSFVEQVANAADTPSITGR